MSENERLALIARAGKHLRSFTGDAPAAQPALRNGATEAQPPTDHGHHPAYDMHTHAPQARPNPETIGPAAAQRPLPVRLNFAQLRHHGMLTPDNLKSNLGVEYR